MNLFTITLLTKRNPRCIILFVTKKKKNNKKLFRRTYEKNTYSHTRAADGSIVIHFAYRMLFGK